jgi:hypothetical protein
MAKALILLFGLIVSCSAHAQLVAPLLQTCVSATEGQPSDVPKWPGCTTGTKYEPISDSVMVATGGFTGGTWQVFSKLPGETMVAVCPAGALLETETRCRTADGTNWATRFVRKDSLVQKPQRVYTIIWEPVTTDVDGDPITVIGYRVETSESTEGPWDEAARVTAPPATVTMSSDVQRCFRLVSLREGAESDPSEVKCHPAVLEPLSKPAVPIIIELKSAPVP